MYINLYCFGTLIEMVMVELIFKPYDLKISFTFL